MAFSNQYYPQQFSLPKPIIAYLMENANSEHLKKLYKSCKYFFSKLEIIIIDNIKIRKHYKKYLHNNYCLSVAPHDPILAKLTSVWIVNEIDCFREYEDNLFIPTLIPKIKKCTIKKITIIDDDLWINEFKLLTKSGNVEVLNLDGVNIIDPKCTLMPFEDVISYIPNANHIQLFPCHVTPETSKKLAAIKMNRKFSVLNLNMIDNLFDVDGFFTFIKKNAAPNASIDLKFSYYIDVTAFETAMKAEFKTWEPANERPVFKCS
uniref:F-box domain-containing protein n=1 Tax=Panagrolaimus sp. ES5 TaxID=591445 RepID=A0AC34GXA4_9BILA